MNALPALRFRRLWLVVGWAMVVAVTVLSLIPLEVDMGEGSDKIHHCIAYAAMMFWFCLLYPRRWRLALALVALGVAIELLQGATGYRAFEVADMVADAVGVMLGWALAGTPLARVLAAFERLLSRT